METTRISCMIMLIVAGATISDISCGIAHTLDIASWIAHFDLHRG